MLKRINSYIKTKLGISELAHALKQQNKKIDFLIAYINLINSELLSIPPEIEKEIRQKVEAEFGIQQFETTLHKNDIMLAGMLYVYPADVGRVVFHYFKLGITTASNVGKLLAENSIAPKNILDFGSGYGRVARFLPHFFPQAQIFVSDVKTPSTTFLRAQFGFSQIMHTEDPTTFPSQTFDAMFALSVFSHLPKKSFENWMDTLIAHLNPGGALIFTFNHAKDAPRPNEDFYYLTQSEEKKFAAMPDSIQDEEEYGSTWVSPNFLSGILSKHDVRHIDLKRNFVKTQNAYLVIKK